MAIADFQHAGIAAAQVRADRLAAGRLHRVLEQVGDHAVKQSPLALDDQFPAVPGLGPVQGDLHRAGGFALHAGIPRRAPDDAQPVHGYGLMVVGAGFELVQGQGLVDEVHHLHARLLDHPEHLLLAVGEVLFLAHQPGQADDPHERRLEVVTDDALHVLLQLFRRLARRDVDPDAQDAGRPAHLVHQDRDGQGEKGLGLVAAEHLHLGESVALALFGQPREPGAQTAPFHVLLRQQETDRLAPLQLLRGRAIEPLAEPVYEEHPPLKVGLQDDEMRLLHQVAVQPAALPQPVFGLHPLVDDPVGGAGSQELAPVVGHRHAAMG
ncbi:hypothetical protein AWY79_03240 [Pseudodesulfovibrio indicus]|uniref:Uncharacterized protein n=1 Tax=Pseudodesulfovibrio indicus TaxID=1716143 RepID=A0ABM5YS30_9BACT|nr:hypothetical protein AWY79_03240 [Pseudodesulfovibrio indicus]